jgi:hypothetical protein
MGMIQLIIWHGSMRHHVACSIWCWPSYYVAGLNGGDMLERSQKSAFVAKLPLTSLVALYDA